MAKRRRLTPPTSTYLEINPETTPQADAKAPFSNFAMTEAPKAAIRAPIADVAGDAATAAALAEVSAELHSARAEGRLIQSLSLDIIDPAHLIRDRIEVDEAEMLSLMNSIRTRGQQTPVEVVELEMGRYGLISGWRRYQALKRLSKSENSLGFTTIQALIRAPKDLSQAYVAMVEENEIRVGLSYFERANIVDSAVARSIFPDVATALSDLFAGASRAKRSKIKSFLPVVEVIGPHLRFPTALTERIGLSLSQKITESDTVFLTRLKDRLRQAKPRTSAEELALITRALSDKKDTFAAPEEKGEEIAPGIFLKQVGKELQITGLDKEKQQRLAQKLRYWLKC